MAVEHFALSPTSGYHFIPSLSHDIEFLALFFDLLTILAESHQSDILISISPITTISLSNLQKIIVQLILEKDPDNPIQNKIQVDSSISNIRTELESELNDVCISQKLLFDTFLQQIKLNIFNCNPLETFQKFMKTNKQKLFYAKTFNAKFAKSFKIGERFLSQETFYLGDTPGPGSYNLDLLFL